MHLLKRALFVITAIVLGQYALYLYMEPGATQPRNARMGEWKKAAVREACFDALETLRDPGLPPAPEGMNLADAAPYHRAREMTAALHCYLVTKTNAVCDPDNRAYIVDYVGKYYDKRDALFSSAKRRGQGAVAMMDEFWSSPRNQDIDRAIEASIREGKLAKSDFGWSTPAPLKPLFAKYGNVPNRCGPVRAASR